MKVVSSSALPCCLHRPIPSPDGAGHPPITATVRKRTIRHGEVMYSCIFPT